jgi:glutamate formiminotransferase/formiminotetrahydrofolate cyclodeaminase
MTDSGKYFLRKQKRSAGVSETELIRIAVKSMGLDELRPFDPKKKIIEYMIQDDSMKKLAGMTLSGFADETASESPAPGGGSISAYVGALGVSLATMVANLSSHKKGWDDRWEEFSDWAEKGQAIKDKLLQLVDEDTNAFNGVMAAFGLPKGSDAEKAARDKAIQDATKRALEVPLAVMETTLQSFDIIKAMAETGNPNSISDAGVGALCARSAVLGAHLNVKINAPGIKDEAYLASVLGRAQKMADEAVERERQVIAIVEKGLAN